MPGTFSDGFGIWYVDRLIELSVDFPVIRRPILDFPELNENLWEETDSIMGYKRSMTLKEHAEHMRRVQQADLGYPIILSAEGSLMDGAHRLIKAYLAGCRTVLVKQFEVTPEPDRWVETTNRRSRRKPNDIFNFTDEEIALMYRQFQQLVKDEKIPKNACMKLYADGSGGIISERRIHHYDYFSGKNWVGKQEE